MTSSAKLGPDRAAALLPVTSLRIDETVLRVPCSIPFEALIITASSDMCPSRPLKTARVNWVGTTLRI
jgi:hypothetical protein